MKRYTVKRNGNGVSLHVLVDCDLGEYGDVRLFWAPTLRAGYVFETLDDGHREQVCGMLAPRGVTLISDDNGLEKTIRAEARRCIDNQKRREARE